MSRQTVPESVAELAGLLGPEPDDIVREMEAHARETEFPTVGRAVGSWLSLLARATDARRVFEFGSGFGYSAYWFARGLPADGELVLTEFDADELEQARTYFERADLRPQVHFEHGDAIELVDGYDGPFDIVLVDNEKSRYREAFETVRGKLEPGSLVLADNALAGGTIRYDEVQSLVGGEPVADATDMSRDIAAYLDYVRSQAGMETVLLPLGEGVAVTLVT
ncbi:MAG: O-methyltransferase [Halovenus sp.]